MSFENPYIFILLMVPFTLFALLVLTNKEGVERVFSNKVLARIKVENSGLSNRARNLIFFIAIFLMIIAMSGPYIQKSEKEIELKGLEVVLALDISGSMRSKDLYPNRLEFAKAKIKKLLQKMPQNEFMILTFADSVFLVSPMTNDIYTLEQVIDGISSDYIQEATNFTLLAKTLSEILKDKEPKVVILVTDGGSKDELEGFKKIIKSSNIKLYVMLVGTKEGAPILDKQNKAILKDDKIVMSRLDESIGKFAKQTGGDYIVLGYGESNLDSFVKAINSNLGLGSTKKLKVKDRVELFYYPLILALILVLIALSSLPTKKGAKDA